MRIAIVDDISEDRLILRSEINAYFQEKSGDTIITFEEFPSGEALLSAFVPGHFQIVFLIFICPAQMAWMQHAASMHQIPPAGWFFARGAGNMQQKDTTSVHATICKSR